MIPANKQESLDNRNNFQHVSSLTSRNKNNNKSRLTGQILPFTWPDYHYTSQVKFMKENSSVVIVLFAFIKLHTRVAKTWKFFHLSFFMNTNGEILNEKLF